MNNFKKVLASGLVLSTLATTAGTVGCFADTTVNADQLKNFGSEFAGNGLGQGNGGYQYTPDDTTYPNIDDDVTMPNESPNYIYQNGSYQADLTGQYTFSTPDSFNSQLPEYYPFSKDEELSNDGYQNIFKAAPYLVEGLNQQDESTNDGYQNIFKAAPYLVEGLNPQNESTNDAYPDAPIVYPSFDDKKVDSTKKSSKLKKGLIITGAVAGAAAVAATGYAIYKGYIPTDGIKNAIAQVKVKGLISKKAEAKDICTLKEDPAPICLPEDKPLTAKIAGGVSKAGKAVASTANKLPSEGKKILGKIFHKKPEAKDIYTLKEDPAPICLPEDKPLTAKIAGGVSKAGKTVGNAGKGIVNAVKATGHGIATAGQAVGNGVSKAGETVVNAGKTAGKGIVSAVKATRHGVATAGNRGVKIARLRYLQAKLGAKGIAFAWKNRDLYSKIKDKEKARKFPLLLNLRWGVRKIVYGVDNLGLILEIGILKHELKK